MSTSKWMLAGAGTVVVVLLATFVAIGVAIGSDVQEASAAAVEEYGRNRVDALIAVVESPAHSLEQRNHAVWALGQLGDARALPTLQRYYTGGSCDHTRCLCQHELQKAIRGCRGAFNASAFLWRWREVS